MCDKCRDSGRVPFTEAEEERLAKAGEEWNEHDLEVCDCEDGDLVQAKLDWDAAEPDPDEWRDSLRDDFPEEYERNLGRRS